MIEREMDCGEYEYETTVDREEKGDDFSHKHTLEPAPAPANPAEKRRDIITF